MEKFLIAVCDDERFACDTIAGAVKKVFEYNKIPTEIHAFLSPEEFMDYSAHHVPDLIYLDIEMSEINGIMLGRRLRGLPVSPDIIYVSNREDMVFQALKVQPFGFVRKGHFMKDLQDITIAYILQMNKKKNEKKVIVMTGEGYQNVPVSMIRYFEGSGTYQMMHVNGEDASIQIRSRMMNLEQELESEGFLRIHKGYLVNYQYIVKINATEVVLDQNEILPVSRRQGQKLKQRYLELSRENRNMLF